MFGPAAAFMSSVTWAIGSARYSQLSRTHSAFAVNLARSLFALPLFVLAVFAESGGWSAGLGAFAQLRWSHWGWFSLSMIASYGLGDVLFFTSTRMIGVPSALAIASAYPLWTALAGLGFRGEHLAAAQWMGLFLTVAGAVFVILRAPAGEHASGVVSRSKPIGVFLAIATSFMWALNGFSVAQGGGDLAAPVSNSVRMTLAIVFSTLLAKVFVPRAKLLLPAATVRASLWVFALEAFGGSYFYMIGLTRSPLAIGATLSSLAPVISVPVVWMLGLEKFSISRSLAVVTVVLGVSLLVAGG